MHQVNLVRSVFALLAIVLMFALSHTPLVVGQAPEDFDPFGENISKGEAGEGNSSETSALTARDDYETASENNPIMHQPKEPTLGDDPFAGPPLTEFQIEEQHIIYIAGLMTTLAQARERKNEMEKTIQTTSAAYHAATDPMKKQKLEEQLKTEVAAVFDIEIDMIDRAEYLLLMARVDRIRKMIVKRKNARNRLIVERVNELLNE